MSPGNGGPDDQSKQRAESIGVWDEMGSGLKDFGVFDSNTSESEGLTILRFQDFPGAMAVLEFQRMRGHCVAKFGGKWEYESMMKALD